MSAPVARAKLEHAMLLIARMQGGDPATSHAARDALALWRAHHPDHEAAYGAAQAGWDATRADALRGELLLPPAQSQLRTGRRRATALLGMAVLGLGTGGLLLRHRQQPVLETALATGRGQFRSTRLPDGSALELDARTRARVVFYRDRREVWLDQGEIRFEVAADAERPFLVLTPWGRVRVLGTVFSVEARGRHMRVRVTEGRVAVWSGALAPPEVPQALALPAEVVLTAGQGIVAEDGKLGSLAAVLPQEQAPWRQGWLVFDNVPLPDAIARWNDYLAVPLQIEPDPALHGLRLTGSFPLRSPAAFVDSLPGVLPVRVERLGGGAARITARH